MFYNIVNIVSVLMNFCIYFIEIDICSSLFYKGYIGGMKFRVVLGVVILFILMVKFLRLFGL